MADATSRAAEGDAAEAEPRRRGSPPHRRAARRRRRRERLVLDDLAQNVGAARRIDAGALLVDKGAGLTVDRLLTGLHYHANELARRVRAGVDESGFTASENALLEKDGGHEKRRKARRERQGEEGSATPRSTRRRRARLASCRASRVMARGAAVEWRCRLGAGAAGERDDAHV